MDDFEVEVTGLVRDEGTVLVLEGRMADTGEVVTFAADRRPGMAILEAVAAGENPLAAVPPWAMLDRADRKDRLYRMPRDT
jgi:hypothetical protein